MTIGTAQLSESLQALVDARLDTIDRMLLGRVSRRDRVAIVREVESQVFELLHDRNADELSREDVLAVLSQLDPPEAYLPDDDGGESFPERPRPAVRAPGFAAASKKPFRVGKASGMLGLCSIAMVLLSPFFYLMASVTQSELVLFIVLFGLVFLMLATSILGIVFAIIGRRESVWAVTGGVTSGLSLLMALLGVAFLILELA